MLRDPYLIVRAAALYLPVALLAAACLWRLPGRREASGALLAFLWNLPIVLLLDLAARRFGWWRFDARGGILLGTPVDLWLAWACFWGAIPAIALRSWPLAAVAGVVFAVDVLCMPNGLPVIRLGPHWLVGEIIGLSIGVIPAQLLARWTTLDERVELRALLQVVMFAGLFAFIVPAMVIAETGGRWQIPFSGENWAVSVFAQTLAIPALIGISAVQEFATRGNGTPVPFDPPRRLVSTGVYAYVRNPMQLSAVVLMMLLGLVLQSVWVAAAGVMAHIYAIGFAGWNEDEDLRTRFGPAWIAYRHSVRSWMPRFRPWRRSDLPPARLFVSEQCDMCRDVAQWFVSRRVRGLEIVAAELHPSGALRRVTYEPNDGSRPASGIEAISRALEHVHLGWAFVGFIFRVPGLRQVIQLLADASGAGPRLIPRRSPPTVGEVNRTTPY